MRETQRRATVDSTAQAASRRDRCVDLYRLLTPNAAERALEQLRALGDEDADLADELGQLTAAGVAHSLAHSDSK